MTTDALVTMQAGEKRPITGTATAPTGETLTISAQPSYVLLDSLGAAVAAGFVTSYDTGAALSVDAVVNLDTAALADGVYRLVFYIFATGSDAIAREYEPEVTVVVADSCDAYVELNIGEVRPIVATITVPSGQTGTISGTPTYTLYTKLGAVSASGAVSSFDAAVGTVLDCRVNLDTSLLDGLYTMRFDVDVLGSDNLTRTYKPAVAIGVGSGGDVSITPPDGFGWTPPITLSVRGYEIIGDVDPWTLCPASLTTGAATPALSTAKAVYVDATKADDSGDGLAWATAKKTLDAAKAIAARRLIFLKPGVYFNAAAAISPDADRGPTALIACDAAGVPVTTPGGVFIQNNDTVGAWTQEGSTKTYYVTFNRSAADIRDTAVLDTDGYAKTLTAAANAAACQATEGTYYLDTVGKLLWVHRVGGTDPTDGGLAITGGAQSIYLQAYDYYMLGITVRGGTGCVACISSSLVNLYADQCVFEYAGETSQKWNGLGLSNFGTCVLRKCLGRANRNDGFNYAGYGNALEIDCQGYDTGVAAMTTANGSSIHGTVKICRVRGDYHDSVGPCIADVDTGKSWNVGVHAYDTACVVTGSDLSFYASNETWYDRCISTGSRGAVGGSGTLHSRLCTFTGDLDSTPTAY